MLLGHSYGPYLARGVAAQGPDLVSGLALLCPIGEQSHDVPEQVVVRQDTDAYAELGPTQRAGFDDYVLVRTPGTGRRYRDYVVPGTELVDEAGLGRIVAGWTINVSSRMFAAPALIVAGRRDSVVGCTAAAALLDHYPHATLAVIDDAGHGFIHERPDLLAALLGDWLTRAHPAGT